MRAGRLLPALVVPVLLSGACADTPDPVTETVRGDISAAVARVPDGSTLRLEARVYAGPLVIEKPLTIIGTAGTVISAGPDAPVLTVRDVEGVTIANLAIQGGESGIFLRRAGGVLIDNVLVSGSGLHGIFAHDAQVEITGCRVTGLRGPRAQGIEIINSDRRAPSIVRGCRIEGPVFEGIVSHVSRVVFADNEVIGASPRGIVVTEMSVGEMRGNSVRDGAGSGLFCGDASRCSVTDNAVANIVPLEGGPRSAMGHGLVVHFGAEAHVGDLAVSEVAGETVALMLGGALIEQPVDPYERDARRNQGCFQGYCPG